MDLDGVGLDAEHAAGVGRQRDGQDRRPRHLGVHRRRPPCPRPPAPPRQQLQRPPRPKRVPAGTATAQRSRHALSENQCTPGQNSGGSSARGRRIRWRHGEPPISSLQRRRGTGTEELLCLLLRRRGSGRGGPPYPSSPPAMSRRPRALTRASRPGTVAALRAPRSWASAAPRSQVPPSPTQRAPRLGPADAPRCLLS